MNPDLNRQNSITFSPIFTLTQKLIEFSGIVQLEIRRARLGDSGTYTCVAENHLGEDSISCEVLVREVIPPGATKN